MVRPGRRLRYPMAAFLITTIWLVPVTTAAQDLVTVSSITGGSSVFVFRSAAKAIKRVVSSAKPMRTRSQRLESVNRIKSQYETVAKTSTRRVKAQTVDPTRIPPNARTLPAEQGARIFAGVGEYYIGQGDYEGAIQFFRDALTLDANNVAAKEGLSEALAMKANTLLADDKAELAKGIFLEAIQYDPMNSAANFGLGEVYSELNQTDEAIASYEKSLKGDPNLTEIYVPLGILYYQTGEIAKADDLLTKALTAKSDSSETQFFLGLVRAAQNKNDEALAAFGQAKRLDPKYTEAFYNYGEILAKLNRHNESIAEYLKAVELKPTYLEAWIGLGEAYFETKKFAEAVEAYKTAIKLKNDNWEI
jgi:tetratricopeptide (TPR) repeat protein